MKTILGDKLPGARAARAAMLGGTALLAALLAQPALAGPYVVDGAELGEAGECEVNAWHTRARGGVSETALAAACAVLPGLELGFTGIGLRQDGTSFSGEIEVKYGLIEPEAGQLGVAVVGGLGYGFSDREFEGAFINLPVTFMPTDEVNLNANLGWAWDHPERRHLLTYGLGAEVELRPRLLVIGEVFGASDGSLALQAGLRPFIVPERLHVDFVYGRSLKGPAEHSFSVGLGFAF